MPMATTGRLISRLRVPAVLISAPNQEFRIGMINSPPATPSRLLTAPIIMPAAKPNNLRSVQSLGGLTSSVSANATSARSIAATTIKSVEIIAMSRFGPMRDSHPAPIHAAIVPPAIIEKTTSPEANQSMLGSAATRVIAAKLSVTKLTRRL